MRPQATKFFVEGEPRPQGSKDQFGRESAKGLKPWRQSIGWGAAPLFAQPLTGPVSVKAVFVTTGAKGSEFGWRDRTPDLDKLTRALLDGLSGVAFGDDRQVVQLRLEHWNRPPDHSQAAGVYIEISEAPEFDAFRDL